MINRRNFIQTAVAGSASLFITNNLFSSQLGKRELELGICSGIDHGALVRKSSFSYLEEAVARFFIPNDSDEKFAENLQKLNNAGIPLYAVNSFLPATLKCVGPDVNTEAILRYAETTFKRMTQTSTKIIVFGSGGSREIPDGYDKTKALSQFVEINKKVGPLAEKYKVTVVLEPLNYSETNLLNTVEEGIALTREIDHPNIRLLADFYHMLKNGESANSIVKAGKLIKHMHIAEKENRTAPGIAGDDFRPFFKAIDDIKYKGKLSIECRWKNMEEELPVALKTIRDQLSSIG